MRILLKKGRVVYLTTSLLSSPVEFTLSATKGRTLVRSGSCAALRFVVIGKAINCVVLIIITYEFFKFSIKFFHVNLRVNV